MSSRVLYRKVGLELDENPKYHRALLRAASAPLLEPSGPEIAKGSQSQIKEHQKERIVMINALAKVGTSVKLTCR